MATRFSRPSGERRPSFTFPVRTMYRLSPGSPSLKSTAPRGASKISNSPPSAPTSSGSTPWNSPARRRISSTCAPRSPAAASLVTVRRESSGSPGASLGRLAPAAPQPAQTEPGLEPRQRRVGAFADECVQFVGVRVVEELLDVALLGDLGQRLLHPSHQHDEAEQDERKEDEREPDHGVVHSAVSASDPDRRLTGMTTEESPLALKRRARRTNRELADYYPTAHCELDFTNPLELSVATILSAQCTDKRVNEVTPRVFVKYRTAADYAGADRAELEELIKPTGFFRNKTNSLIKLGQALVERFDGEVPNRLDDLVTLPGFGRKTANVV